MSAYNTTHGLVVQEAAAVRAGHVQSDLQWETSSTCDCSMILPAGRLRLVRGESCTLMLLYAVLYPTNGSARVLRAPSVAVEAWSLMCGGFWKCVM